MITKTEFDRFTFDAFGPDGVAGSGIGAGMGLVMGTVGGRSAAPVAPRQGTGLPIARPVREQQLR